MKGKIIMLSSQQMQEKEFDKRQYTLMTKALDKLGMEGMWVNKMIAIYNKLTVNMLTSEN